LKLIAEKDHRINKPDIISVENGYRGNTTSEAGGISRNPKIREGKVARGNYKTAKVINDGQVH